MDIEAGGSILFVTPRGAVSVAEDLPLHRLSERASSAQNWALARPAPPNAITSRASRTVQKCPG